MTAPEGGRDQANCGPDESRRELDTADAITRPIRTDGGRDPDSAPDGGDQPTQPAGGPDDGQPTQPAGGPDDGQPAQPAEGQGQTAGQPTQPTGGPGHGDAGGQSPQTGRASAGQSHSAGQGGGGFDLRGYYDEYAADLPLVRGVIFGVVVYVLNFLTAIGLRAAIMAQANIEPTLDLQQSAEILYNAHYTSLQVSNPSLNTLPLLVGIAFFFVPWFIFSFATRLVSGACQHDDPVTKYARVGAAITVGYFPAIVVGSLLFSPGTSLFPSTFGSVLLVAGLVFPVVFGGLAGVSTWFFTGFRSIRTKLLGYLVGLLVLAGVGGLTTAVVRESVRSDSISLAINVLITYIGAHLFQLPSDSDLYVVTFVPLLVVFAVGFLRTWRIGDRLDSLVDGVRSGGAFAFAYVSLTSSVLISFLLWSAFSADIQSVVSVTLASGTRNVTALQSAPEFFWTVVIAGLVYPLVVGGLGGVAATFLKQR